MIRALVETVTNCLMILALLPCFFAFHLRPTIVSLLLKYTDLASLLPSIQRSIPNNPSSASTSAGSSATFTTTIPQTQPAAAAATFSPSTTSFPGSASGSDAAEVDSSEFGESSVHTGTGGTGSGAASLSGSGYVGMDGSWVGLDRPGVPSDG